MWHWRDAHTLGQVADALEATAGRHGFYQEKHYCWPVLVEDVHIGFGNASLQLTPVNADGSLWRDAAFSLLGPLASYRTGALLVGLAGASLVIGECEAARLRAAFIAGASAAELREQVNLLELDAPPQELADRLPPAGTAPVPLGTCSAGRQGYVYLAFTGRQISMDALIPGYGRMVTRGEQCLQPLFLLWELASMRLPQLTAELIACEREHARVTGARPLLAATMDELFGDDQGARWAFGQREGGLCASALMCDADLVRVVRFIAGAARWQVEAEFWPGRTLPESLIKTYHMSTHWHA